MKSLHRAFKEYLRALTFSKKAHLVWNGSSFTVSYYYSDKTLKKLDWEVIL